MINLPYLIFSDKTGKIYSHPFLRMAASSMNDFTLPREKELIKLPKGSALFYLPHKTPIGFNPETNQYEPLLSFKDKEVFAVGAFLIPAYLRLYLPAIAAQKKQTLPLWAYTAAGFHKGSFYVSAVRIDKRIRQNPKFYKDNIIKRRVRQIIKIYSHNRLYKHLANCACNYNCLAAKNLFMRRWEAPIPVSRLCNARCLGCLSYQESDCASSHERINFKPDKKEIVEIAVNHLKEAKEAIVSFGQGCEGEPLLEADLIADAIREVREKLNKGTIHMNTNASIPQKIEMICKAGIDSFRVSLNSTQEEFYNLYFRPVGYNFSNISKSIDIAKRYKKFVSINLLVFPGLTDSDKEIKSLIRFIKNTGIDMIQWRNLNIDPDYYLVSINAHRREAAESDGMLYLIKTIRDKFPHLKMGYFNLPKERFTALDKYNPFNPQIDKTQIYANPTRMVADRIF